MELEVEFLPPDILPGQVQLVGHPVWVPGKSFRFHYLQYRNVKVLQESKVPYQVIFQTDKNKNDTVWLSKIIDETMSVVPWFTFRIVMYPVVSWT